MFVTAQTAAYGAADVLGLHLTKCFGPGPGTSLTPGQYLAGNWAVEGDRGGPDAGPIKLTEKQLGL